MARLLLFDIDMTLVRTTGAGRRALNSALERLYGTSTATEGVSFDGRTDHGIFNEILTNIGQTGVGEFTRLCEVYLSELPDSLRRAETAVVLPGVVELLAELKASHGVFGLGTGNIRAGAKVKLGHFGLWEQFAGGGFGDHSGVRSELIAAGIQELAAVAGVDPDPADCIIIGDTPLDIVAAHAAGARALAVATGNSGVEALRTSGAEWVLADLSDVGVVMEILAS